MTLRKRTAVLISGRGSNLAALISAAEQADYPTEIALVVSNAADAGGLAHARDGGIACATICHRDFGARGEFENKLGETLRAAEIELVCLAGFMRILSPDFVEAWRDRLLNIHPSLLPAFPGLNTHERALQAGVRIHGATVHFVRADTDSGPIIAQGAVPVTSADTAQTLAARVLAVEHRLYPLALALVARGDAHVVDERVRLKPGILADDTALLVPSR